MNRTENLFQSRSRNFAGLVLLLTAFALFAGRSHVFGQDKAGFPDGYDAVQVAPKSHRVLFENAFVRVLEVIVPPGTKEPMHSSPMAEPVSVLGHRRPHRAHSVLYGGRRCTGPSEQRNAGFRGQVVSHMDGTGANAFD